MKINLKSGEDVRISADGDCVLRTYVESGITHVTALPKDDIAAGVVVADWIPVDRVYQ